MKTRQLTESVRNCLDLIFFGDWDDQDDFDAQLDSLAEYSESVRESVIGFNEAMSMA